MNKKIWKEKPTYQQIKYSLINLLSSNKTIAGDDLIELGLQSLQRLNEEKRAINVIYKIDRISPPFQKIPSILTASILLDKYKEKSKDLTDDELTFLSIYSSVGDIDYKRKCIERYDHQILNEICKKTKDIDKRVDYLALTEYKFSKEDAKNNKIIKFIKETSTEEFDKMIDSYEVTQIFDEVATKEKLSL